MSEEDIKAYALELGLDPKRLTLNEPVNYPSFKGRRYDFYYQGELVLHDCRFIVTFEDIEAGIEAIVIKGYVEKGLRKLAKKLAA